MFRHNMFYVYFYVFVVISCFFIYLFVMMRLWRLENCGVVEARNLWGCGGWKFVGLRRLEFLGLGGLETCGVEGGINNV